MEKVTGLNFSFQICPAWSDILNMESADTQPNL